MHYKILTLVFILISLFAPQTKTVKKASTQDLTIRTDVKTYNCTIMKAHWSVENDELHFVIKADRFLRNMVRAIVGTMINIGIGKMGDSSI